MNLCLRLLVLTGLGLGSVRLAPADEPKTSAPSPVRLVVDYNDGVRKSYEALAYSPNMTVLDALKAAKAHSRPLAFEFRGDGETAFVTSIDGIKNEGGGRGSRNWIYQVNAQRATKSCGIHPLAAGDTVVWSFGRPKTAGQP